MPTFYQSLIGCSRSVRPQPMRKFCWQWPHLQPGYAASTASSFREEMTAAAPVQSIPVVVESESQMRTFFVRLWTTYGGRREPSIVHELTKKVYTF